MEINILDVSGDICSYRIICSCCHGVMNVPILWLYVSQTYTIWFLKNLNLSQQGLLAPCDVCGYLRVCPAALAPAVSRNLGIWESWNLGIWKSGNPGIWESGNLEIWKSGNLTNSNPTLLNVDPTCPNVDRALINSTKPLLFGPSFDIFSACRKHVQCQFFCQVFLVGQCSPCCYPPFVAK